MEFDSPPIVSHYITQADIWCSPNPDEPEPPMVAEIKSHAKPQSSPRFFNKFFLAFLATLREIFWLNVHKVHC